MTICSCIYRRVKRLGIGKMGYANTTETTETGTILQQQLPFFNGLKWPQNIQTMDPFQFFKVNNCPVKIFGNLNANAP